MGAAKVLKEAHNAKGVGWGTQNPVQLCMEDLSGRPGIYEMEVLTAMVQRH